MASAYGNKQKHESHNPAQRALLGHFKAQALRLVGQVQPKRVLEVGCGEGYMLEVLADAGIGGALRGVDISAPAIDEARIRLGARAQLDVMDCRDLAQGQQRFDLVMMLEVLEHLESPGDMLHVLDQLASDYVLLSVPWEPFFRGLNMMRGKHVRAFGNDPEHLNHWGRSAFLRFVGQRFDVVAVPLVFPWTMALAKRRC